MVHSAVLTDYYLLATFIPLFSIFLFFCESLRNYFISTNVNCRQTILQTILQFFIRYAFRNLFRTGRSVRRDVILRTNYETWHGEIRRN